MKGKLTLEVWVGPLQGCGSTSSIRFFFAYESVE